MFATRFSFSWLFKSVKTYLHIKCLHLILRSILVIIAKYKCKQASKCIQKFAHEPLFWDPTDHLSFIALKLSNNNRNAVLVNSQT